MDLVNWSARPRPARAPLEGRYVRLEPLEHEHADTLYQAASAEGAEDRFRWLFENAPQNRAEFDAWIATASASTNSVFFAVIDKNTGRAEGRQALMRIDQTPRGYRDWQHHVGACASANAYGDRGAVPICRPHLCPRLPAVRVEVQRPKRAFQARGPTLWFSPRGRVPSAHGGQERQPRHRLVRYDRPRLAAPATDLRDLAFA